ncbi:hypothetical protein [Streptomyces sp. NPDC059176]|uniref:hypothetical protein n=1 Tax=unclassified Streptomyces TaxID=2593676 RepID=UPI0036891FBE
MHIDDSEPQPAFPSGPDSTHSIMDAFQQVLDSLDAARAELLEGRSAVSPGDEAPRGREPGVTEGAHLPGRNAAEDVVPGGPTAVEPGLRIPPQPGGAEDWDPFRPRNLGGEGATPRPDAAAAAVVVEPLWARDAQPYAPPAAYGEPAPWGDAAEGSGVLPAGVAYGDAPEPHSSPWFTPSRRGVAHGDATPTGETTSRVFAWPTTPPAPTTPATPARPRSTRRSGDVAWHLVKPGRLAGVCGAGAVGGLIAVSSLLGGDTEPPGPPVQPSQPPGQTGAWVPDRAQPDGGARDSGGTGADVSEAHQHHLRVSRIHDSERLGGHYAIAVQEGAARFQDPSGRA